MTEIRAELPEDVEAIRRVHERAFRGPAEARLVDLLRRAAKAPVSLVAIRGGQVVGHILFSPVALSGSPASFRGLGLAPVGVLPELQRSGIGSALVRAGLELCRQAGYEAVFVLGDPRYYNRFGFGCASDRGLGNDYGARDEFMALELRSGALEGLGGKVSYAPEFRETGC